VRIDWSPLFGYDVFISYKRGRDHSSQYALQLKARLAKADFQLCSVQPDAGNEVDRLEFSPNGEFLATRHRGAIHLWDALSGELLSKLAGEYTAFTFSPDSQFLATADSNARVRIWDLRVGSWMDWACRNAERNLTKEEWAKYMPGIPYRKT
jgi:WD40 repeat protein